ncbi:MAG: M55 family metallopeptidase [Lachnospiraceae bacterium]|nr:M55 family metallopeptidase [Robinsoniella sp.]MDY3766232.1 M55 family metallopeptidase [Lachnospiraceae bacterium]
MKIYISADIEGITGVTCWESTNLGDVEYAAAAKQMTAETLAACQAAIEMGADEIVVKDAHDSGRNLDITAFPKEVKVLRDWDNSPESMIAGIDGTFDGILFIGYHSGAGFNGSPLSHTMNRGNNYVKINGELASEFLMHSYLAESLGVPSLFVSGDKMLCEHVKKYNGNIETVAVKEGFGSATLNLSPAYACDLIKEGVKKAIAKKDDCHLTMPNGFDVEINFKDHYKARRASFFPGVTLLEDGYTVRYHAATARDMAITRMFIL